MNGVIPPYADETTFNGYVDYETCVLHVPEGTISVYREASIWQNFRNIIDDVPTIKPTNSIEIQGGDRTIDVGDVVTLCALTTPDSMEDEIRWESSDSSVVSVDSSGTIEGLSVGVAEISAYSGDVSDSITVTVNIVLGIGVINYDEASVAVQNREIIIKGMPIGDAATLVSADGAITRTIISDSTESRIPVEIPGIYILKIGNRIFKINTVR